MAKALIGHLDTSVRGGARLTSENARLRRRVAELEALVLRLQQENDRLTDLHASALLDLDPQDLQEMLPA